MRPDFPRSLVQIHFHDRIGGVRRTMETYARTFSAAAGEDAPNILICRKCTGWNIGGSVTVDLPGADYHTFRTRQAYRAEVGRLAGRLEALLTAPSLLFPAAVIGHNLNLGKNPALAAAFTHCARTLGRAGGRYRFFGVLHDFAEAGRVDIMASLRQLGQADQTFLRDLYGADTPVHYIVPDRFSAALTGLPPENITVLPHPVDAHHDNTVLDTAQQRAQLGRLSKLDGLRFDPEKKLYCYPSRMIYRKNGLEALLVATIVLDGALLIGPCGTSPADRKRFSAMLRLSGEYRLPLAVDPSRLSTLTCGKMPHVDPFKSLYPSVDAVISTSIAEGYGYSLVEPWASGVPVIGRNPSGIHLPPDLTTGLYARLPVPVSWVSIAGCYEYFSAAYTASFGRRYASARAFAEWFVHDDSVDFGMLETGVQMNIIVRVMCSDADRDRLITLQGYAGNKWQLPDKITATVLRRARAAVVRDRCSGFGKLFVNCLRHAPRTTPTDWCERPGEWYRQFSHFLPLVPRNRR